MKKTEFEKAATRVARALKDVPRRDKDFVIALYIAAYHDALKSLWHDIGKNTEMPEENLPVVVEYLRPNDKGEFCKAYASVTWNGNEWTFPADDTGNIHRMPFQVIRWMPIPAPPSSSL